MDIKTPIYTGCIMVDCHVFERLCSFPYFTEFGLQYPKLKLKTAQIDQKNNIFEIASNFKLSRWRVVSNMVYVLIQFPACFVTKKLTIKHLFCFWLNSVKIVFLLNIQIG